MINTPKTTGGLPPYWGEPLKFTGYVANLFYPASIVPTSMDDASLASGTVYYVPFVPITTHTFTGLAIYNPNGSFSGNQINMSIYDSTTGNIPNDRLFAAVDVTLGASQAVNTATISQELTAGVLYFLGIELDTTSDLLRYVYDTSNVIASTLFNNGLPSSRMQDPLYDIYAESAAALPVTAGTIVPSTTAPAIMIRG